MTTRQPLLALEHANRVRFARTAAKRGIRAGRIDVVRPILACPPELGTMPIAELLQAQRWWGPERVRRFLRRLEIGENHQLRHLTERQRRTLAGAIAAKRNGQQPVMNPLTAHQVDIAERIDPASVLRLVRYRAECNQCGWVGEWRPTEEQAQADGDDHEEAGVQTFNAEAKPTAKGVPSATTR